MVTRTSSMIQIATDPARKFSTTTKTQIIVILTPFAATRWKSEWPSMRQNGGLCNSVGHLSDQRLRFGQIQYKFGNIFSFTVDSKDEDPFKNV